MYYDSQNILGGAKKKSEDSDSGMENSSFVQVSTERRKNDEKASGFYKRFKKGDETKERYMSSENGKGMVVKSENEGEWVGKKFSPDSDAKEISLSHDKIDPNQMFKDTFHIDTAKLLSLKGGGGKKRSKKSKGSKKSKKSKKGGANKKRTSMKKKVTGSRRGGSCCGKP